MTHVDTSPGFAPAAAATRAGRVAWWSIAIAVLLVALGVVVVREALVVAGRVEGDPWIAPVVDSLDGVVPSVAVAAAGVVVALLGLWLVVVALGRRVRTRLAVTSSTGTTIGIGDAARLAASAADEVDRVLSARATATRRSVTVTVTTLEGDDVTEAVRAAVTERLAPLVQPLSVTVVGRVTSGLHAGGDGR
ncbi:DUF6286 domain-containing protein [Cellulomonas humilata]|uniref:DUF6286 domain-containing protein n=1 Tax=Cellulomonas humilata TaxID=144055 RepID=A0ABU0EJP0_9CELL|nr:DUF6286 domain-containing protein [Cellulomonas humilata]MDQ0375399.1 hypothetical protein [Cellulomonas humilata]